MNGYRQNSGDRQAPSTAERAAGSDASVGKLAAIVAMTPSGVIGRDGDMPWRLSSDLKRFKRLTMGGTLIMGRRTFESIGRPLPGRTTIVVTRQDAFSADGVLRAPSPDTAVTMATEAMVKPPADRNESESMPGRGRLFVVGGAEIYRQLIPRCQEIFLTRVWSSVTGDTSIESDWSDFQIKQVSRFPATERDDVPTEFLQMRRISGDSQKSSQN